MSDDHKNIWDAFHSAESFNISQVVAQSFIVPYSSLRCSSPSLEWDRDKNSTRLSVEILLYATTFQAALEGFYEFVLLRGAIAWWRCCSKRQTRRRGRWKRINDKISLTSNSFTWKQKSTKKIFRQSGVAELSGQSFWKGKSAFSFNQFNSVRPTCGTSFVPLTRPASLRLLPNLRPSQEERELVSLWKDSIYFLIAATLARK